jgi:Lignostilbene-alpha,beta-dioxygenase and related enzymes
VRYRPNSRWYLRNGPNPREADSRHWFLGDGMVHGVRLDGGRATSYRNRWVRTATFTHGAKLYDAQGTLDLTAGVANTHIVRHAGRTLALVESSLPYELSCTSSATAAWPLRTSPTTAPTPRVS